MGMSRSMVISVDGDARAEVERAQVGIFVEPENVDQLTEALLKLAGNPALRQQLGQNGRRFVDKNYRRGVLARQYAELLDGVIRHHSAERARVTSRGSS